MKISKPQLPLQIILFFKGYKGEARFTFLNNQLVEILFFYDDMEAIAREYFPYMKIEERRIDGFVKTWMVANLSNEGKIYVGVSDTRLRDEYLDAIYVD